MDYKSALEIDRNNLDEEAAIAPQLFDEFANRLGPAKSKYETLRDALKILMADVNLEIRGWSIERINQFFQLQLPKATEDVYKNLVLIHPKVINMHEDIAKARREAAIYEQGKDSMDKKIFMLNNLKDLHGQGYFAKIEGGSAFRKINIDMAIDELASAIADRIDREGIPYTEPAEGEEETPTQTVDQARAKLAEEIARRQAQTGAAPSTSAKPPKTPKPKKPVKRVKASK